MLGLGPGACRQGVEGVCMPACVTVYLHQCSVIGTGASETLGEVMGIGMHPSGRVNGLAGTQHAGM